MIVHNIPVTCCGDCPRNKVFENKLGGIIPLPPSHHCIDTFNTTYPERGNIILNPNDIPKWCPHVSALN